MSDTPLTIDDLFLNIESDLHDQFMACFNHFLEKKQITADEFNASEHMYIYDLKKLWETHSLLLASGDESYGKLVPQD